MAKAISKSYTLDCSCKCPFTLLFSTQPCVLEKALYVKLTTLF